MDQKSHKQKLLDALYRPYKNCTSCPLGFLGRTHVVFGEGDADATIMFIGEGPGRDEDAQGRPFVGRSGQLLNRILEVAELKREAVYITNIVKCRPPNNRAPTPEESATCMGILLKYQIKIIRPRIICTLGAIALQNLLSPDIKISRVRGTVLNYENVCVVPTYHPAYILRNQKELEKFANDIILVKKLADDFSLSGG